MFNVTTAAGGIALVVLVWLSVLRTTLIPRRSSSRMARWTARGCATVGTAVARRLPPRPREWVMEFCAPVGLFLMSAGWLSGLALGFALLAVAADDVARVLTVIAITSAVLVLTAFVAHLVIFMEAYRRRERMTIRWATQLRRITDAETLLADHLRAGSRDSLDRYFAEWAGWLADIGDSHLSCPGLVYQRSTGDLSWPKAALIIMDAAALVEAVAPRWAPLHARMLLDSGSACLQRLAKQLGIVPPVMTISLQGREERAFGDTMRLATESGLPAERDVHQAQVVFQKIRLRYAPYVVLIGSRLLTPWNNEEVG